MVLARQEGPTTFDVVVDGTAARAFVEAEALVVQAGQGPRGWTLTVPVADVTSVGLVRGRAGAANALAVRRGGAGKLLTLTGQADVLIDLACLIADVQEALKAQR